VRVAIREYKRATKCELGGRLRGCRRPMVGQCQYCARGFCAKHGERFGDREEVCGRPPCQAKRRDLAAYEHFKVDAAARNDRNMCGLDPCETRPELPCERCGGHFCVEHLRQHVVEVVRGVERAPEVLRLCLYCIERIPVWERA
jgi:hypothetical protein